VSAQLQIEGIENERERWAEYDACFTPRSVVHQALSRLRSYVRLPKRHGRLLDPSAGAGVFGQVARAVFPCWNLVGIEPRVEERPYLEHHYDHVVCTTAQRFATDAPFFDVVASNPPWWCWGEVFDAVWPLVLEGGVLAFLGPSTWGHSDEASECVDVFERVCPAYQWRVRGRIAFNGGSGTDNRKCSWWVFVRDSIARTGWLTENLPALPPEARRWTTRPGTEV
jgi:hypothetical protein